MNDRKLAAQLRTVTLRKSIKIMEAEYDPMVDDPDLIIFQQQLHLKLAGTVLPRLNEVSGPEGKPIPIMQLDAVLEDHSNQEDSGAEEEN